MSERKQSDNKKKVADVAVKKSPLQRAAVNNIPVNSVPPIVRDTLQAPGQQLDTDTRAFMESRFDHDFSSVRVHSDAQAAESARAVNALAYTVGQDVVFGQGQYAPTTGEGKKLLAHELTHVVQQDTLNTKAVQQKLIIGHPDDSNEREADSVATQVTNEAILPYNASQVLDGSAIHTTSTQGTIQRAVAPSSSPVDSAKMDKYQMAIMQYQALVKDNALTPEEISEIDQAISKAELSISQTKHVMGKGKTLYAGSTFALAATAGILADDVTGFGVLDDPAAIITGIAALGLAASAAIMSSNAQEIQVSKSLASDSVLNVISIIGQILLAKKVGEKVRGLSGQIIIHLARILGTTVGGQPPSHQQDPKKDRPHWWHEIKTWLREIKDYGLSPKQLLRELSKKFTLEQIAEIREAIKRAAEMLGEDPPDFPPSI